MRVLLMIQNLWRGGGTETHVLTLALGLRRMGHQVAIYTFGGPWVAMARSQGLAVQVGSRPSQFPVRARVSFADYVRKNRFNVIHAHDGPSFNLASQALPLLQRKPAIVYTVHGYISIGAVRRSKLLARAVIAVSPPLRHWTVSVCNLPARMVYTIRNGVQTNIFRPIPNRSLRLAHKIPKQAFVVGYAGRFTSDKWVIGRRIAEVLRTFTLRNRDCHVLIAGRNARTGVRSTRTVHVLGHVGNMERFYNACDVVIGTGRVAAEAIACGVPTMVIGNGGYRGIVTKANMKNMLDTNFGDHGIGRKWTDVQLRNDLALARRRIILHRRETQSIRSTLLPHISSSNMVRQTVAVYRKIL